MNFGSIDTINYVRMHLLYVISYNKSLIKYIKCIKIHVYTGCFYQMSTSLITTKLMMVEGRCGISGELT